MARSQDITLSELVVLFAVTALKMMSLNGELMQNFIGRTPITDS